MQYLTLVRRTNSRPSYSTVHCTENQIYVFPEKEMRGLSPKSYIHVSMSGLCIPRIGPHTVFGCSKLCGLILGI
jgi:hypothetical protein